MSIKREDRIRTRLQQDFRPDRLEVQDVSEAHRGHAGWQEGGETHFHIRMASAAFRGLSRIERQRRVNKALKQEFENGLHALSMELDEA